MRRRPWWEEERCGVGRRKGDDMGKFLCPSVLIVLGKLY